MKAGVDRIGPRTEPKPPASLRPLYSVRRKRSVAAVRAAITALAAEGRRVTLAGIERVSHGLPEGMVSAKTVLRNLECRALYAAAAGNGIARRTRSGQRALRAELAAAAGAPDNPAGKEPCSAELRRVGRLDRRNKQELAAMVVRPEREVEALHRHSINLRECLLRNGLGAQRAGRGGAGHNRTTKIELADVIGLLVLWPLRCKPSLRDLPETFAVVS